MKRASLDELLDSIGPDDGPDVTDLDPRWEALTRGELDEAEVRRLQALAASSRRAGDVAAAFEPLDDDFVARTTERLLAMRPDDPAPVVLAAPAPTPTLPSLLARIRAALGGGSAWRVGLGGLMVPVLVAALALVAVVPPAADALPAYRAELHMGDRAERGADDAPAAIPAVSAGSKVDVVARPAAPVDGPVSVGVFRLVDGRAEELALDVTVATGGVVRVRGVVGEHLDATPGPVELRVVVLPGSATPTPTDALAATAVPVRFEVVGR